MKSLKFCLIATVATGIFLITWLVPFFFGFDIFQNLSGGERYRQTETAHKSFIQKEFKIHQKNPAITNAVYTVKN